MARKRCLLFLVAVLLPSLGKGVLQSFPEDRKRAVEEELMERELDQLFAEKQKRDGDLDIPDFSREEEKREEDLDIPDFDTQEEKREEDLDIPDFSREEEKREEELDIPDFDTQEEKRDGELDNPEFTEEDLDMDSDDQAVRGVEDGDLPAKRDLEKRRFSRRSRSRRSRSRSRRSRSRRTRRSRRRSRTSRRRKSGGFFRTMSDILPVVDTGINGARFVSDMIAGHSGNSGNSVADQSAYNDYSANNGGNSNYY